MDDTSKIKSSYPIPGSASSMTPERRLWMSAILSREEAGNPGTAWHEWLGSALLALDAAESRNPLSTTWMGGPPPGDAGWVWREGEEKPVWVYMNGTHYASYLPHPFRLPWGTARWAPIPKPSDKAPEVPTAPATSPALDLDGMTIEEIKAYLKRRQRDEYLMLGVADGFERLPMEADLGAFILHEGCWVWRDSDSIIRRAFGCFDAPGWDATRMCWATFNNNEVKIAFGRLREVKTIAPMREREMYNPAWLAEVRAWLLAQPIEKTG